MTLQTASGLLIAPNGMPLKVSIPYNGAGPIPDWWIILRPKKCLPVMASIPILVQTPIRDYTYNFMSATDFWENGSVDIDGQAVIPSGDVAGLLSCPMTGGQDLWIEGTDWCYIFNRFGLSGYQESDLDYSGVVGTSDVDIWYLNWDARSSVPFNYFVHYNSRQSVSVTNVTPADIKASMIKIKIWPRPGPNREYLNRVFEQGLF